MLDRRGFLGAGLAVTAGGFVAPACAQAGASQNAVDSAEFGVRPGSETDLSANFTRMLNAAAERDAPVFLPPGNYVVSDLPLPRRVRLTGVPGATRVVLGGHGRLMAGADLDHLELTGVTFVGAHGWLADEALGLLDLRRVRHLAIDNCAFVGSAKHGIALEQGSGRIDRCTISGAADAGIYSVDTVGLRIAGNTISDCGNGGILVHRRRDGDDGTMVTDNRIERIAARSGGTGQNGNGINIFHAGNVVVARNVVADCAFSAIRANSASNVQIAGNTCLRSGETGIYSEFSFEGAVINSNIVDGAANGISIVNFNEGGRLAACSGNIIRNLSAVGPYAADPPGFGSGISVEADCAVTGNVVEGAPRYGIAIGWGEFMRNVVATGNIVRKTGYGIAISVVEGVGSAVVTDNIVDSAEKGAIVGARWAEIVTGDLALSGADFPHLIVERNRTSY